MQDILILGQGFTGKTLLGILTDNNQAHRVQSTSRSGQAGITFDLDQPSTWNNLPRVDATFWLFPARPPALVADFLRQKGSGLGQIVAVGSTGALIAETEGAWVNETTPREDRSERAQGEELVRQAGGIIVYASGIYGPGRNPLDWVRAGRVKPSSKFLNVIHVDDLGQILIAAWKKGQKGDVYLASDGSPRTWQELCSAWENDYHLVIPPDAKSSQRPSKRVDPSRSLERLGVVLRYPDVHRGVAVLEKD